MDLPYGPCGRCDGSRAVRNRETYGDSTVVAIWCPRCDNQEDEDNDE